jgi:hypothetical protein
LSDYKVLLELSSYPDAPFDVIVSLYSRSKYLDTDFTM